MPSKRGAIRVHPADLLSVMHGRAYSPTARERPHRLNEIAGFLSARTCRTPGAFAKREELVDELKRQHPELAATKIPPLEGSEVMSWVGKRVDDATFTELTSKDSQLENERAYADLGTRLFADDLLDRHGMIRVERAVATPETLYDYYTEDEKSGDAV
jgi:hypothetical protein